MTRRAGVIHSGPEIPIKTMETQQPDKTPLDLEFEKLHGQLSVGLVTEVGDCAIIAKRENGIGAVSIIGGTVFVANLLLYILSRNQEVFYSLLNNILFGEEKGYIHLAHKIARLDAGTLCRAIDTETEYRPILIPKTATKEEIIAIIESEYEQRTAKTTKEGDETAETDV